MGYMVTFSRMVKGIHNTKRTFILVGWSCSNWGGGGGSRESGPLPPFRRTGKLHD